MEAVLVRESLSFLLQELAQFLPEITFPVIYLGHYLSCYRLKKTSIDPWLPIHVISVIHWHLRQKQCEGFLRTFCTLWEFVNRLSSTESESGVPVSKLPFLQFHNEDRSLAAPTSHPCPSSFPYLDEEATPAFWTCLLGVGVPVPQTGFFTSFPIFSHILPFSPPFYLLSSRLRASWGFISQASPSSSQTPSAHLGCDFLCSVSEHSPICFLSSKNLLKSFAHWCPHSSLLGFRSHFFKN